MIIEIENTSSPGASFTKNTNMVLLKTYEWIYEHKGTSLPFREFRMALQKDKNVNDNNNRNIYPLLKNGGLVNYEKNADLYVDHFFTNNGLAYVETLKTTKLLEESKENYSQTKISAINRELKAIQEEIITDALQKIVKKTDVNYVEPLQNLIKYLICYKKISKIEYAYLLYMLKQYSIDEALVKMKPTVDSYRAGSMDFVVHVKVRNDLDIKEKTNSDNRKESISFLTSFGYFSSLLSQAGLVTSNEKYIEVTEKRIDKLQLIGG